MGAQQLHRHEPDQPEASDNDRLAEGGLHQTDALEPDRAEDSEGGFVVRHRFRDFRAEIHRHADDFGVPAVGDDTVADREAGHAAPTSMTRPTLQ